MRPIFIFTLLYSLNLLASVEAQPRRESNWSKGILVLNDGDTLRGNLYFAGKPDKILFKNERLVRYFPMRKVAAFEFYDEALQLRRYFARYPSIAPEDPFLFEKIILGRYHFLKAIKFRYISGIRTVYKEYFNPGLDYYLWDGKKLSKIINFKQQLEAIFDKHGMDLKNISKQYDLSLYLPEDQMKAVYRLNYEIARQEKWLDTESD